MILTHRKIANALSGRFPARTTLCFGVAMLAAATPIGASAQDRDFQLWASVSATTPLGRELEMRVDTLSTLADEASTPGRQLLRLVALAKISSHLKGGGGGVWTHVDVKGARDVNERRAVQELDLREQLAPRLLLVARTQIEERWRERTRGMSLRWRQLTRLELSLAKNGPALVGWNEYFHELRGTAWAGDAGPSLMLNFVGVRLPVTHAISAEPGYLNQTNFLKGRNGVVHAAALFVTVKF
jgi:hypothetical protein